MGGKKNNTTHFQRSRVGAQNREKGAEEEKKLEIKLKDCINKDYKFLIYRTNKRIKVNERARRDRIHWCWLSYDRQSGPRGKRKIWKINLLARAWESRVLSSSIVKRHTRCTAWHVDEVANNKKSLCSSRNMSVGWIFAFFSRFLRRFSLTIFHNAHEEEEWNWIVDDDDVLMFGWLVQTTFLCDAHSSSMQHQDSNEKTSLVEEISGTFQGNCKVVSNQEN